MGSELSYTAKQVTTALALLAENAGNYARTADELREQDFEIRASTLRQWKTETHVEQYRKLEDAYGHELEQNAVQRARQIIEKSGEKMEVLLERAGDATGDQVPQALRAVADVQAKSGNLLMQLTGRPTNPKDNSSSDIVDLLKHMVDRGYLNLAPDVKASVEGTAVEID